MSVDCGVLGRCPCQYCEVGPAMQFAMRWELQAIPSTCTSEHRPFSVARQTYETHEPPAQGLGGHTRNAS